MAFLPDDPGGSYEVPNTLVDKWVCKKLLKSKKVAEPMLGFILRNLVEEPETDLQWAAMQGFHVFRTLCQGAVGKGGRHPVVRIDPLVTPANK